MKILLDLSESKVAKVQLLNGNNIIDFLVGDNPLLLIDEILRKNNLKLADIKEFDSYPGPGSFTGLKVGATIVNILNWQIGNERIIKPMYELAH